MSTPEQGPLSPDDFGKIQAEWWNFSPAGVGKILISEIAAQ